LLVGVALWLAAQGAAAAPITLVQDLREIRIQRAASTQAPGFSLADAPDSPFAAFTGSLSQGEAAASQTSSVGGTAMTGSGQATAFLDIFTNGIAARSTFDIRFEVTAPTLFALSGELTREDFAGYVEADAELALVSSSTGNVFYVALPVNGNTPTTIPFATSGLLTPGSYRLYASAFSLQALNNLGRSGYAFSFVVPEPAAGLLLLAGLAAAFAAAQSFWRVRIAPRAMPMPSRTSTPTTIHCVSTPASLAP
jgi:hypothetical protein